MRTNWKQKVQDHFKGSSNEFSLSGGTGESKTVVVQLGGGNTKTFDEPTWEAMFQRNCRQK